MHESMNPWLRDPVNVQVTAELRGGGVQAGAGLAQGGLDQQQGPGGERRDQAEGHGAAVFARHGLKGLGGDDQPDPQQDAEHCFQRDHLKYQRHPADQAQTGDHYAVEQGVARAGPHRLPAWMTDVDGGRKGIAEQGRHQ